MVFSDVKWKKTLSLHSEQTVMVVLEHCKPAHDLLLQRPYNDFIEGFYRKTFYSTVEKQRQYSSVCLGVVINFFTSSYKLTQFLFGKFSSVLYYIYKESRYSIQIISNFDYDVNDVGNSYGFR